jgi:hypothetical protein
MRVCKAILALYLLITIVIGAPASNLTRRFDDSAAFIAADGFDHDTCFTAPSVQLARVLRTVSFVDVIELPSTLALHATPVLITAPKTSPPLAAS